MSEDNDTGRQLLVAFTDSSPNYTAGFEAGRIWERMGSGYVDSFSEATHTENRETLRRMAEHQGWVFTFKASDVEGWDFSDFEKRPRAEASRLQ